MAEQNKQLSLEEITIINFPSTIIPQEAGDLFAHLSEELECDIRYTEEINYYIGARVNRDNTKETVKIQGNITKTQPLVVLSFELIRAIAERNSRYSGLKFFTIPGYDLDEINPKEIEFMKKAKQSIDSYFKGNKVHEESEC